MKPVLSAPEALPVLPDQLVHKVLPVWLVRLVRKDRLVRQVRLVRRVLPVWLVQPDPKALPV